MKLTIAFPNPNTHNEWCKSNPEFQTKEIEVIDKLIHEEPMEWGKMKGKKMYFLPEGSGGSYWHFVVIDKK
ncbi:MAG TPA: hypothetical protein VN026_18615 [Bacteroidia bacterium]|jgi:hypothetical protein|nr:hypothetical protein [Bacteroidia bacterium]